MKLLGIKKLTKLKAKNKGNVKLYKAVDKLEKDIKGSKWKDKNEVIKARPKADCIHNDGFYIFNLNIHRTMVLIEYQPNDAPLDKDGAEEDMGIATVHWTGTHDEYIRDFKNNKDSINKWLRGKGLIE
ncbi:MAG: hypothetical protein ACI9J3_000945 [Parvicellaceae bacterium]